MKLVSLLALTLGLINFAPAQDIDSATLLKKMTEAYKAVKTAKFSVQGTGFVPGGRKTSMEILFKAPESIRAVASGIFSETSRLIFTTTGNKVTITDGDGKKDKQEVDFDQMRLTGNLETLCFWDYAKQLSTSEGGNMQQSTLKVVQKESWNGKDWIVLEEDAPALGVTVRYFIDPKSYLIWRTVMKVKDGDGGTESWITKLELDVKVEDSDFKAGG